MRNKRIIFSGGGTGGHIYPAISIANELLLNDKNLEILFIGANNKMEMKIVPEHGFDILGLWISGYDRKNFLKNLLLPFKILVSFFQSILIIKNFKPQLVIGTGGYASGPILYVANLLKTPSLIQEQNSYPGITNRILSKKVNKICVSYENLDRFFPKEKIIKTGNPVRQNILKCNDSFEEAINYFKLDSNKKIMLVVGGSLGSKEINKAIYSIKDYFKFINLQVIWQCGRLYYDYYNKKIKEDYIRLYDYIENIDYAYSACDFIISRAGASSVSELSIVGKPVIFIPSPNVAENHQLKNAKEIIRHDAAILVKENEINILKSKINDLNSSSQLRNKLSRNIKRLSEPNATKKIVNEINKLLVQ
jgi:UDP-N-acetylglucosamine--N-acetylmuramyl-(pentapeptide) pyrophosphoryl-undecaprenol N-acetylglucosamine transferase